MTLQDLLKQSQPKTETGNSKKEEQRKKTEALITANKLAAASILKSALSQLERNSSTSTKVEKRIWI